MKKFRSYIAFAALLLSAFLFTSCKNKFQCTCTDAQGNITVSEIEGSSRSEAKITCESVTIAGETCVLD